MRMPATTPRTRSAARVCARQVSRGGPRGAPARAGCTGMGSEGTMQRVRVRRCTWFAHALPRAQCYGRPTCPCSACPCNHVNVYRKNTAPNGTRGVSPDFISAI